MNVNFNGYRENVLTFIADSSLNETGVFVKMTTDGTVGKCSSGENFCGVCVGLRGGYAAVQLTGYVQMPTLGSKISAGYRKLSVGDGGRATVSASGREVLVLDSTTAYVGFIL